MGELLSRLQGFSRRYRWSVIGVGALLWAAAFVPASWVEVHGARSFFSPGSEPWKAERFLEEKFGGSQIVMVVVSGDLIDPATLQEMQRVEEFARHCRG